MIGTLLGLALPVVAVWWLFRGWRLRAAEESRIVTAALAVGGGLGLPSLTTTLAVALGTGFVAMARPRVWGMVAGSFGERLSRGSA
jgi:hypothetical protein